MIEFFIILKITIDRDTKARPYSKVKIFQNGRGDEKSLVPWGYNAQGCLCMKPPVFWAKESSR